LAHAETWSEFVASHDEFVADDNYQVHWAHRERQDGRHSPAEVLGWVQGVQRDPAEGHWSVYSEHGLANRRAAVWLYGETRRVEFSNEPLVQYSVLYEPDYRHLREIVPRQLFQV
jgi:hypothetical protein